MRDENLLSNKRKEKSTQATLSRSVGGVYETNQLLNYNQSPLTFR